MSQIPITLPDLSDAEAATIRTSYNAIKAVLAPKFINLEPEDRTRFGSINEKNKLIINKVRDYRDNMPGLSNPDINWANYIKNSTTRKNYMLVLDMLGEITELCNDPRILVDYTLYGDARKDYKYTKYKAEDDGAGAAGFEQKYDELKQFFAATDEATATTTPKG
jgi:hypothetical protein